MKKKILIILSLVLLFSLLVGCTQEPEVVETAEEEVEEAVEAEEAEEVKGTVKIGVHFPLTGDAAQYGLAFSEAAKLLAEQANAAGGCGGYMLELEIYDDKLSGEEAATIADIFAHDDEVVAVVAGYYSGVIMAGTPIYQENGLPIICPSSSHPDFTSPGEYIFRNNSLNITEVRATLDIVTNYLQGEKIGILVTKNDWGLSTGAAIQQEIEDQGVMEVVAYEEVLQGSDDYSIPVANFIDAGCDTIIAAALHDIVAPFIIQYKELDPDIQLGAFAQMYNYQTIEIGGDAVNGIVFGVAYTNESEDPDVIAFRDAFLELTGELPDSLAAQTYDSVGMVCEAIANVGPDREAIKDYLTTIEYDGVMGLTAFDENRTAIKEMLKFQIQDGEYVQLDY